MKGSLPSGDILVISSFYENCVIIIYYIIVGYIIF